MIDSDYNSRSVVFIDAKDVYTAQQAIMVNHANTFTTIDTTSDFNQNKWLGQELADTLVYFDNDSKPNGLLSLFGCVKAPHTLYLSCDTKQITDYFKKNILLPRLQAIDNRRLMHVQRQNINKDEEEINQVLSKLAEYEKGIIHLIGERGSGKSTLLGKYIATQKKTELDSILLSSPSRAASQNTFVMHRDSTRKNQDVSRETIPFFSPYELLKHLDSAKIIIIDEAATYSKSFIKNIIEHVLSNDKLLILSTTIEGYEGTGQSYRLNYLNDATHTCIQLKIPKRYSENDPLYRLTKEIYCLNNNLSDGYTSSEEGYHTLSTTELREKGLTTACFALLKQAHYKTTPNDLARFYNDDALFVIYIERQQIIGVAYALKEDLPDNIDTIQIYYGNRRLKNAFTQQALLQAYGNVVTNKNVINQSHILRISRIAVEDNYRRKGIASKLINRLEQFAIDNHYDYLSTSFSYSDQTFAFWQSQQFIPVRVGLYPNKASHAYAILMLLGLKDVSRETSKELTAFFRQHIGYFYQTHKALLTSIKPEPLTINEGQAIKEIVSVTEHHRDINWALPILSQYRGIIENNDYLDELFNGCIREKATKEQDLAQLVKMKKQLIKLANQ